jgi:hypothetical protein
MRGNLVSNELLPMLLAAGARKRFPIYWRYCQVLMIFWSINKFVEKAIYAGKH